MDNVGLKRGVLELMDYREDYSEIYEEEKKEINNERDNNCIRK